jgi:hypothetical protein
MREALSRGERLRRKVRESAFAATPLRRDSLRENMSEGWLGGRDSNPDKRSQSPLSYR